MGDSLGPLSRVESCATGGEQWVHRQTKPQVFIRGAGDHIKVVIETIRRQGRNNLVGLLDDDRGKKGAREAGIPDSGRTRETWRVAGRGRASLFRCHRQQQARRQKTGESLRLGFELAIVLDPTAIVLSGASIGAGTVILGYSYVGVDVGPGCIPSMNCCVGHDSCLADYAHLTPGVGLGRNANIGEESFWGLGAVVLPGVHIGQRVTVGAGAAVVRDLPDDVVAVGVPARIMRRNARGE